MYLKYDSRLGPVKSAEQPDERKLRPQGQLSVSRHGGYVPYELFADERGQVWAKEAEEHGDG